MVTVDININAILVNPIKSHKDTELTRAYLTMMLILRRSGIMTKKHILDNEVSESLKTIMQDEYKMQMKLVPPDSHRRNAAEVAVRNFKAHFMSALAGIEQDFPPSLWDRLLPQSETTTNLLRQSNTIPKVSA